MPSQLANRLIVRRERNEHSYDLRFANGTPLLENCDVDFLFGSSVKWQRQTKERAPSIGRSSLRWRVESDAGDILLTLNVGRVGHAVTLNLEAVNASRHELELTRLRLLNWFPPTMFLSGNLSGWSAWLQGRQMTSDTLTHRLGTGERHDTFARHYVWEYDDSNVFSSQGMLVLSRERESLLLGFITHSHQFSDVRFQADDNERLLVRLDADTYLDSHVLAPGESVASETLMIAFGDDPVELVDSYARETARRMKARVPKQVPSGWCSWYFFYNQVSEQNVVANLDKLKESPSRVDYVQIDDGFQAATGDWLTPNERFPRGMKPLAQEIAAAGFRPGLWLAPFTVNTGSRLFAEHPEWMLKDADGHPIVQTIWLGPCAGLDCTHPGAQEWLRHLIRTVVHDFGYTFLKLDALFCACYAGARHHVPNTTTAANLRLGLEIIREAAGDDAFILGCSCPFGPAIGLVDAMRVGADVEARWFNHEQPLQPSAKHAMRLSLPRFWMHRRFWLNDPDCLTVRDDDSPIVPGTLTLEEARFLATGIALSGGLAVLSDDLSTLSPERRDIALRVLPPTGRAARPLDLLERETPALWSLPLGRSRLAVAALNWDDEPMEARVSWSRLGLTGPHFAREQWTERDLGRLDGELRLDAIPPHAARVVILDPARPPRPTRALLPVRR